MGSGLWEVGPGPEADRSAGSVGRGGGGRGEEEEEAPAFCPSWFGWKGGKGWSLATEKKGAKDSWRRA